MNFKEKKTMKTFKEKNNETFENGKVEVRLLKDKTEYWKAQRTIKRVL